MESIGNDYFNELVSSSFLQREGVEIWNEEYFMVHDLMYELALQVSGTDIFRIENGCKRDIPKNTRHLYVESDDIEMLEKIPSLQNLRTLIIENPRINLESMLKHPKLWILIVPFHGFPRLPQPNRASRAATVIRVPDYVCHLKYLRYFSFVGPIFDEELLLPSKLAQLYQLQVLDFGECNAVAFLSGKEKAIFSSLRHVVSSGNGLIGLPANLGSCTSLQTLSHFNVKNEKGFQIKELQGLNDIRGTLRINGLEHIRTREEALEANLSSKIHVSDLILEWLASEKVQPDIDLEVLESLCPSPYLDRLQFNYYAGSAYPQWLVGEQTVTERLRELSFCFCRQHGPAPELSVLVNLEALKIKGCSWTSLPSSLHSLTKLKNLSILFCPKIQELPILPISLQMLTIYGCSELFAQSCKKIGHPNWEKAVRIPRTLILGPCRLPNSMYPSTESNRFMKLPESF